MTPGISTSEDRSRPGFLCMRLLRADFGGLIGASDATYNRFVEWCCSEAHAEEYVKGVWAQKVQAQAQSVNPEPRQRYPRQMCGG